MKKILVVLFFLLLIAPDVVYGHIFDKSQSRYDPEDVRTYIKVFSLLREGKLEEGVEKSQFIKDYELRWMALYAIATDGYASRGEMEKAVALMEKVMVIFREVTNVERFKEDFESYFQGIEHKFLEDVIVAAVENGHWEKSLSVFPKISRLYYRLQMIEKVVLRMPNKKIVENFLAKMDYKLIHKHNSISSYKDQYDLIILYGVETGIEKAFIAFHKLTPFQFREWLESR